MTAAPYSSMVLSVARTICGWRNGKRSAVAFDQLPEAEQAAYLEQAQDALDACQAEEMREALKKCLLVLGGEYLNKSSIETALKAGISVLAKLDGQP